MKKLLPIALIATMVMLWGCTKETDDDKDDCPTPTGLQARPNGGIYWNHISAASYYELQYGPEGFALGTGTKLQSADNEFDNFYDNNAKPLFLVGKTYDYYVRTNCSGGQFSDWAGPRSFYVEY